MGQPLKPGQRRGFDTHFGFNNPCHWTSPGISLFQPPRDPGSLHPGCMCLFSAHLFPSVGQHSWQVPEYALHPTGLKLPALGVPALARALLEHPAGRVPVTAAARCPHQTKKKKPRGSASMQGSRCFSEESACPPALPCRAPGAAALASPWKSLRALEGSAGTRRRAACSEHQRQNPSASSCSADSQRVSLCLSAVTSAFLSPASPGAHGQPLPESRSTSPALPRQAGKQGAWPGAAAFPGRAGMCSQESRPGFLPHSLFMKTASHRERAASGSF